MTMDTAKKNSLKLFGRKFGRIPMTKLQHKPHRENSYLQVHDR